MKSIFEEISKKSGDSEFFVEIPDGYVPGKTKYIVITGTVISGIGKGAFSSSLGFLLQKHGFAVESVKFDGYLNLDAGTMNPFRHGEVFVMDDGTEADMDFGTYERFLDKNLSSSNYLTGGRVFSRILKKEREGAYLGRDVQFIPHVTGEIKYFFRSLAMEKKPDFIIIEVGGTVGDIENSYFIEAMRQLSYEEGQENVCFINLTYILEPTSLGEQKTKASQLGIKRLMSAGIQPDVIVCRGERTISEKAMEKISVYSNISREMVIDCHNLKTIYEIPLWLEKQGLDKKVLRRLGHKPKEKIDLDEWKSYIRRIEKPKREIVVGIAGKYTGLKDSYASILKAVEHSGAYWETGIRLKWIETTDVNKENVKDALTGVSGLIVPGGFGARGTEGKIACVQYARENNIPYLGLCFGLQMAVIEFARNVCRLEKANSTEIDPKTPNPVIDILPEQKNIHGLGGTMRLGGQDVHIIENTLAHKIYGKKFVRERFRHRFEVNPDYHETLKKNGLVFSGWSAKEKNIVQIIELKNHPFFIATQFHPEFTSRPLKPNPIYREFIKACIDHATNA
ncbi:MAG: CTP synthetase [Candidatus Aenigmarchaeota archaeon ex4484_14]|nr:MAG: CTP synthetase [Candidatus Aenigmarchaeota archaeon ex4484_14]